MTWRQVGRRSCCLLLTFSLALTGLPGCDPVDKLVSELDKVLNALLETRARFRGDLVEFQGNIKDLLDNLDKKVSDTLEAGPLGRFVDMRFTGAFEEMKTMMVMVERRVLGYLDGVISALKQKREEIRTKGGVPADTVETILAEIIASVDRVEPFVGHLVPSVPRYQDDGSSRVLIETELTACGYGFAGRQGEFALVGVDRTKQRVWTAPSQWVDVNHDFRISILPRKDGKMPTSVERLAIFWTPPQGSPVEVGSFSLKPAPVEPPKPRLTHASIELLGTQKNPSVAFRMEVGDYSTNAKTPLVVWDNLGEGQLWLKDVAHGTGLTPISQQVDDLGLIYLELTMVSRSGGTVQQVYVPSLSGTYVSRTGRPKGLLYPSHLERMGFIMEWPKSRSYVLRGPRTLVLGDWRGRVRLTLHYDRGLPVHFDESPEIVFKKGKSNGSFIARVQFAPNGRDKN